ncbi:BRO-N domain-containing protein, partial [Staphylococcus epidermidis]
VDAEDKGVGKIQTPGGMQNVTLINESGLYSLIFSSKLESAKRFKRWVTSEVLPTLRKTGTYQVPSDPMQALKLMFKATEQTKEE